MTGTIDMIKQAGNQDVAVLKNFPIEGMGIRAMGCKMYDKCLYKAAIADWESFNCVGCDYEGRGALEFIDPDFLPVFEEPEMVAEGDLEMEMVDLIFSVPSLTNFKESISYNDEAA